MLFCFRPLRPHGGASTSVRVCVCVCVCVCSFCFIEHGFISRFYSRRWPLVGWWVPFSVLVHKGYCLSKLFFFSSSSSLFNALVCAWVRREGGVSRLSISIFISIDDDSRGFLFRGEAGVVKRFKATILVEKKRTTLATRTIVPFITEDYSSILARQSCFVFAGRIFISLW